jgi:hypothetical protein
MAGENLQSSLQAPSVQAALENLFRQIAIVEFIRPPNMPIAHYELPNAEMLAHWRTRLAHATRDQFIVTAGEFLGQVEIPGLGQADCAAEHLSIFYEVSRLRDNIIAAVAAAAAAGYPRPPPVTAQRDEIAAQLAQIGQYLAKMSSKVDALERATLAKKT